MEEKIWTNLQQDIIIEILSWVPAKSLITSFKFVCKAWRSLIQDPVFIKMHLNQGAINGGGEGGSRSNKESLIRKPISGNGLFQLHPFSNSIVTTTTPVFFEDFPSPAATTKLDFDLSSWRNSRLVGSCNGLLCLSVNDDESIILLNPSIRKYKVSPKQPIECPTQFKSYEPVAYGFGCYYNSTTTIDVYKIVRIAHFSPLVPDNGHSFHFQINTYSMNSNSWRTVKDIPPCETFRQSAGVFLNGIVHWMGYNHEYDGYDGLCWDPIVSFNIRDEEFGRIPMSSCVEVEIDDNDLINLRGYLGMVYFSHIKSLGIDVEIWVMKEYGIRESWTKEFVIRSSDGVIPFGLSITSRFIMTCFLTGDQLLIEGRCLLNQEQYSSYGGVMHGIETITYGRRVLFDMNKKEINEDLLMVDIRDDEHQTDDQVDYIVSLKSSLLPLSNKPTIERERTVARDTYSNGV